VFWPEHAITGIPCYKQIWPPEKQKRANLALFFNKTAGLTQAYILKAIQGLQIVIDTITNATNISPLATKNSGFVAIIWHHGDYISLC